MNNPCDLGTPNSQSVVEQTKELQASCASKITNKKRKSPGLTTPLKKSSRPRKKALDSGGKGSTLPNVYRKIDLRLEEKLSAEENSKMFAGRQIHPFFSSWKVEKKSRDSAGSEGCLSDAKGRSGRTICGPIHVFEDIRDYTSSLDWSDWKFLGNTTVVDCGPESSNLSVMEGSVESLNFDNFLSGVKPPSTSISQNALSYSDKLSTLSENMKEMSPENSAVLANEPATCTLKPENAIVDLEMDDDSTVSGQACIFGKSDTEPPSMFLRERMSTFCHSCEDKAESSLWIHKYKPAKASEVCGNSESLKFLSDWLHLWHERRYQNKKGSSNKDHSDIPNVDSDYNCPDGGYASKDEGSLKNVLLITGPVGSGKSAAVYACAREQGFEVLELNASDCRNGAAVKQYFGDALGSHGVKGLVKHSVSLEKKTVTLLPASASPNVKADEEMADDMIEMTAISDDGTHSPGGTFQKLHDINDALTFDTVQTLILVEDVDILFPEDRGCIAAIQHIAETAKGPIILTSNNYNAGLPINLCRQRASFSLPLPDELLCHLFMVCGTEEVNFNPLLLEKFIHFCDRDIRKTIMHLQFWLQNKKYSTDKKVQTVYGSLPFDLEAGHKILPKMIPWSFPSELSKLIENEVSKSITIAENNSRWEGLVNEELCINDEKNSLDVQCTGTGYLEPKVEVMKRIGPITDCSEFDSQYSAITELSNCSGSPVTSSLQKDQGQLFVMSSDDMDEDPNNRHTVDVHDDAYTRQAHEGNTESFFKFLLNQSYANMSFCELLRSSLEDSEEEHCKYLDTTYDACLNKTDKSPDLAQFPEPCFVSETAIQNRIETKFGVESSGQLACPVDVSLDDELKPFSPRVCQRLAEVPQDPDFLVNTEIPKSSPRATSQDFTDVNMEIASASVYNTMDECSQTDSKLESKCVDCPSIEIDMVQNSWRKLRDCRTDLRQHATSEQIGAIEVVKLASGLSDLISEADLLFRNHQQKQCGIMEPPVFLADDVTFSWYDEQMMMSTVAVHGFCFYAKQIVDAGSIFGFENRVDVASEMLASTTNIMALGKLSRQDHTKTIHSYTKELLEMNNTRNGKKSMQYNESRTPLFNVIRSIVPKRSSSAIKGIAFNEFLSSLRHISISEGFQMSQGVKNMRKGRRSAQHYLSRGKMMLSPEDISLMCEGDLYSKISSQYAANMENNTT
ncbi:uncharacterized protein LOC127092501 isoform X2 [Lathyrus oleraceus]|uniref:ATPase AAA-type core domain-containing protein n=2 Tax=Pisum sativum TaxID=3888 RepID=A0A9D4W1P7_PEA|nr:uncharacterized protein LOC127092501 isoform X2 [Pisum sativum]KAI5394394.1 hypothetical protein KIW84_061180 [Pisum sativum]